MSTGTAEAAHDFANLLSVITCCADELAESSLDAAQRERVEEIRAAASRGATLTRGLIEDSRPETGSRSIGPTDVGAVLDAAAPLLKRTAGPLVTLTTEVRLGLPRALCDPSGLERALVNLAANARDAMPAGGQLRIRAGHATIGTDDPGLAPGWYVRIDVTDTGLGMGPEVLRRIAEPYFSTKAGDGSGLGLPAVFGTARAAGGDVRVSSRLGSGTTVSILLRAVRRDGTPLALGAR